ncbi:hypothetical protein H5410_048496 [Solanum commersonii]|uniref:Uncharacterized protein n=1 Tax=Solanum commersonii TaxID=4109 RepID=A0A9J5XLW4_SOLCO|nr:hypothetical protein H5410_048496 [Solanum commersonii]
MAEFIEKETILLKASLPRGRVPRSRSSPCTNIPGRGRSRVSQSRSSPCTNMPIHRRVSLLSTMSK